MLAKSVFFLSDLAKVSLALYMLFRCSYFHSI